MSRSIQWYNENAQVVFGRYESVNAKKLHAWLNDLLPKPSASVLDVGAGSGRDAAWLAELGYDVIAVEPSNKLREKGINKHGSSAFNWIDDSMPSLEKVTKSGLSFDVILLSAVWMHLPEKNRARAFRKLITLLKPGGLLAITLRNGKLDKKRSFYRVSREEIESLAKSHGAYIEHCSTAKDQFKRSDVSWIHMAIRLPDDGTGALPLLRHVILNEQKSSTYKLALLRSLCRVANGAAGMARPINDDYVSIPLGLVALTWIRLFKPLLASKLPQTRENKHLDGLAFVKDGYRKLNRVSHHDLRIGCTMTGDTARALHAAIKDSANTITRMPATHMTYPDGGSILPFTKRGNRTRPQSIVLDMNYLGSFGEMHIPSHLWSALQRFDVWIEPAIISEWTRIINSNLDYQHRENADIKIAHAMVWAEKDRDVVIPRKQVSRISKAGQLYCVWSGRKISADSVDMDHCLPWSAWPCSDLWNILPSSRELNRNEKREKLPSSQILDSARDRFFDWWDAAYLDDSVNLRKKFWDEANASLPTGLNGERTLEELFEDLCSRRFKIKTDQQVPEWSGDRYWVGD